MFASGRRVDTAHAATHVAEEAGAWHIGEPLQRNFKRNFSNLPIKRSQLLVSYALAKFGSMIRVVSSHHRMGDLILRNPYEVPGAVLSQPPFVVGGVRSE